MFTVSSLSRSLYKPYTTCHLTLADLGSTTAAGGKTHHKECVGWSVSMYVYGRGREQEEAGKLTSPEKRCWCPCGPSHGTHNLL